MRVGIEIGGTFTDYVAMDEVGKITTCKVMSTPKDPADGALNAVRESSVPITQADVLIHGSTVATNAVLERKGAVTSLVTTRGFRDILEIQRHERTRVYELYYQKARPIVPRHLVIEVDERLGADGTVVRPLDGVTAVLDRIAALVREEGVAALAVVLLNSYRNSAHERALGEAIRARFPDVPLTLSCDVLPEFREYERASTTVISGYLKPVIQRYMKTLEGGLSQMGFSGDIHIMQSNGGIFPIAAAQQQAVNVILSGPAAGVVGATYVAEIAGWSNVITLDMGGTSTDVCLVHEGKPLVTTDNEIADLPIRVPMVEIITVGAGGGSIAFKDPGGLLKVGPESAGADPGPSCYGRGGVRPTVTDAHLLCGLIRPDKFFGGKLRLQRNLAESAIAGLAKEFDMDSFVLAEGIIRITNSNMMDVVRLASLERGHDPRDYTLVAFGGAGGLHACHLSEELEIDRILVPENPGLMSAFGLLVSDFRRGFVQTELTKGAEISSSRVLEVYAGLEQKGREEFSQYRVSQSGFTVIPTVDLRYLGQDLPLNIDVDLSRVPTEGLKSTIGAFHKAYERRCGHCFPEGEVEVVNYRMTVVVPRQIPPLRRKKIAGNVTVERGRIFLGGRWIDCQYYDRRTLPSGFSKDGPAVIEEPTATTFVEPGWRFSVDDWGNLILSRL